MCALVFRARVAQVLFVKVREHQSSFREGGPHCPHLGGRVVALLAPSPLSTPASRRPRATS